MATYRLLRKTIPYIEIVVVSNDSREFKQTILCDLEEEEALENFLQDYTNDYQAGLDSQEET